MDSKTVDLYVFYFLMEPSSPSLSAVAREACDGEENGENGIGVYNK